jgi:oxygen-independent coproporphyrinogen-3 oxidase
MAGLYIHIPFCVRKCRYCDFYSVPHGNGGLRARFLQAIDVELQKLPDDFIPQTLFIGGGTPTSLDAPELAGFFESVKKRVDVSKVSEWSCEANPRTLDWEKAKLLRETGVNRVSLGVQSFDPQNLAFLGRIHSSAEAKDACQLLRDAGFENLNVDLMYGIPGSSREILERDLALIANLDPEHVACYCLMFEEGTELTRLLDEGSLAEVDDAEELEQYRLIRGALGRAGFRHYEISNFAKPGYACQHNLLYWSGGDYIGCGPSAHSHWKGLRYGNVRGVEAYCEAVLSGGSPREFEERLEPEAKARETLIMGLRRLDGVSRRTFRQELGFDYRDLRGKEIDSLRRMGLLEERDGFLRLTEKGFFVSDSVFRELV